MHKSVNIQKDTADKPVGVNDNLFDTLFQPSQCTNPEMKSRASDNWKGVIADWGTTAKVLPHLANLMKAVMPRSVFGIVVVEADTTKSKIIFKIADLWSCKGGHEMHGGCSNGGFFPLFVLTVKQEHGARFFKIKTTGMWQLEQKYHEECNKLFKKICSTFVKIFVKFGASFKIKK